MVAADALLVEEGPHRLVRAMSRGQHVRAQR